MDEEISLTGMHPGVKNNKRIHPLVNTCGNSSLNKRLTKQLAGIERHLETHPKDSASQMRVSTIKSKLSK